MDTPLATNPPSEWRAVRELFDAALALPARERQAFIDAALVPVNVKADALSLLQHHPDETGDNAFLNAPAAVQILSDAPAVNTPSAREGQRFGAWQIVRSVGTGGMGDVFEARRADGSFEGRAAIKLLKRGMDSTAVLRRFAQERQALARLSHPHIARLLDAGASDDGLPYFVMEFVAGVPIDEAVRGLPLEARLNLFLQLADAVAHAHRNLLVHRDLKPGNVLVTAEGEVKLLDFGIAKALDPFEGDQGDTTVGGQRPYTPNYASPEQVRGEPVSTATDIYSLGVLLYQLLTGVRPTGRAATTPMEAARSVLEEQPTRPSSLSADLVADPQWMSTRKRLQGDLDNILLKALEKSVDRRYASVDALAADVQNYLAHRPVNARPASVAYVLRKFVSRNRWAVLAATLGSVGLTTGLAAALLQGKAAAALGVVGLTGGLGLALVRGRQAAVSRDEATRQLGEIKRITTDIVFNFGDALTRLPGGMKAQEALLQQTLASLDTALCASPKDPDLIALVASALGRIAELQGSARQASAQRADEASATVKRALALADRVWRERLWDWRFSSWHIRTLTVQAQLLRHQGQPGEGLVALELAAQRCSEALLEKLPPEGRAHLVAERGAVHIFSAQMNAHATEPNLFRPDRALTQYLLAEADYRTLLDDTELLRQLDGDLTPGDVRARDALTHQLAAVLSGQAVAHGQLDNVKQMLRVAQSALTTRQDNLEREPNNLAWRDGFVADTNVLAMAQLRSGDAGAALESIQLSWRTAETLATEEGPQSKWAQLKPTLAPQYAKALAGVGRHEEALVVYDIALRPLAALLSATDPKAELHQQAQQLRLATLQVWCAKSLRASGQNDAAAVMLESASAALKQLGWRTEIERDVDLCLVLCLATMTEGRVESSAASREQAREAMTRASLKQALGDDHRMWLKWLG
jgi:eukaryotic-like serine/threonine-protein kinase